MENPGDLSVEAIRSALATHRLGRKVLYFPSIGSTNDVLRERAAAGAPEGLLAVADEQTAGRGRVGRSWWAPPGTGLLMSLLLRPPLPVPEAGQTTMCLGLGALDGIEAVTGLRPGLKWPNDLVLQGRKLGGMLTEMDAGDGQLNWVVLGLGLNVNLDLREGESEGEDDLTMPPEVAREAGSLSSELGYPVNRLALLAAIVTATERWYDGVLRGESPFEAWAVRLDTLGRAVRVVLPDGEVLSGIAESVEASGALTVREPTGSLRTVWAGDVVTLRPADS